MAITRALIQFQERAYQTLYNDFRVYIQGAEVTDWIIGSVQFQRTNRDGPGTASFTLDNAMDRFVITDKNLAGTWRDTTDQYSEAAKHQIYLYKTGQVEVTVDRISELTNLLYERNRQLIAVGDDEERRRERRNKNKVEENSEQNDLYDAAADTVDDLPADDVLNNKEAVTDAIAGKLAVQGLSQAKAKEIATEVVQNRTNRLVRAGNKRPASDTPAVETVDGDPELAGRHRRESIIRNPVDPDTGDARWPLEDRSAVFHRNDPIRIFVHNPLTERDEWLYGFTGFINQYPITTDYTNGESTIQIQCYDLRELLQKMRVQQNTVLDTVEPVPLFQDRTSIFADLVSPSGNQLNHRFANTKFEDAMAQLMTGTFLDRRGAGRRFGVGDFSVGKVVRYPVTNEPSDQNRALLEEWHTLSINEPTDITDDTTIAKTALLTSADVDRVGRETTTDGVYAPTRGFVHFLLPKDGTAANTLVQTTFDAGSETRDFVSRYEIITDFCARLDYEFTIAPNGDCLFEFPMYDFLPEDYGGYSSVMTAEHHLINTTISDEGNDIITAVTVMGGPERTEVNPDGNAPPSVIPRAIVQSSVMAARVGLTVEQVTLPFVRDAARLGALGFIEFQKRLANANSMDMDMGFRPFLMPNRPVYNVPEKRMGLLSNVANTMQLFGSSSTGLTLKYIRQVRVDGTFRLITGGDSMPISYRDIFPSTVKSPGNGTKGVRRQPELNEGTDSALDNQTTEEAVESNDDAPPRYVGQRRPGTYFTLTRKTRLLVDRLAQQVEDRFVMNNPPDAVNQRRFAMQARDDDGNRLFTNAERLSLAITAEQDGYLLVDTGGRFWFEPRRSGQPTFVVKSEAKADG